MTDVLYQDSDICILHPDAKRGTLVYHTSVHTNICNDGLLSLNELRRRSGGRGRQNISSNLIYFRAPFTADLRTFKTAFKVEPTEILGRLKPEIIVILRIDPDKTFVYSSEARSHNDEKALAASRVPFAEYIRRIATRESMKLEYPNEICGNVITYETKVVGSNENCFYPWIKYLPIERNAEVVAALPHILPTWFVACYKNKVRVSSQSRSKAANNK